MNIFFNFSLEESGGSHTTNRHPKKIRSQCPGDWFLYQLHKQNVHDIRGDFSTGNPGQERGNSQAYRHGTLIPNTALALPSDRVRTGKILWIAREAARESNCTLKKYVILPSA